MVSVIKYLQGKKTYCIVVALLVTALLKGYGYNIPDETWLILSALGLGFIRAGVNKVKETPNE